MKEHIYHFTVILSGTGIDPESAWRDAYEGFSQDPGATPASLDYEIVD